MKKLFKKGKSSSSPTLPGRRQHSRSASMGSGPKSPKKGRSGTALNSSPNSPVSYGNLSARSGSSSKKTMVTSELSLDIDLALFGGQVGKTSLLTRFLRGEFDESDQTSTVENTERRKYSVDEQQRLLNLHMPSQSDDFAVPSCRSIVDGAGLDPAEVSALLGECCVDLSVLDTCGDLDSYEDLRQSWFDGANGFIFVYSVGSKTSFDEMRILFAQWKKAGGASGASGALSPPASPRKSPGKGNPRARRRCAVLVGTQADVPTERRQVKRDVGRDFMESNKEFSAFFEVSARTGAGVADAFQGILCCVAALHPNVLQEAHRRKKKQRSKKRLSSPLFTGNAAKHGSDPLGGLGGGSAHDLSRQRSATDFARDLSSRDLTANEHDDISSTFRVLYTLKAVGGEDDEDLEFGTFNVKDDSDDSGGTLELATFATDVNEMSDWEANLVALERGEMSETMEKAFGRWSGKTRTSLPDFDGPPSASCVKCGFSIDQGEGCSLSPNKQWHKKCFVCSLCNLPFTGPFIGKNTDYYHPGCQLQARARELEGSPEAQELLKQLDRVSKPLPGARGSGTPRKIGKWKQAVSPDGTPFWWHTETKETQWATPSEPEEGVTKSGGGENSGDSGSSPSHGEPYYSVMPRSSSAKSSQPGTSGSAWPELPPPDATLYQGVKNGQTVGGAGLPEVGSSGLVSVGPKEGGGVSQQRRCERCNSFVGEGDGRGTGAKIWHKKCFVCYRCTKPFTGAVVESHGDLCHPECQGSESGAATQAGVKPEQDLVAQIESKRTELRKLVSEKSPAAAAAKEDLQDLFVALKAARENEAEESWAGLGVKGGNKRPQHGKGGASASAKAYGAMPAVLNKGISQQGKDDASSSAKAYGVMPAVLNSEKSPSADSVEVTDEELPPPYVPDDGNSLQSLVTNAGGNPYSTVPAVPKDKAQAIVPEAAESQRNSEPSLYEPLPKNGNTGSSVYAPLHKPDGASSESASVYAPLHKSNAVSESASVYAPLHKPNASTESASVYAPLHKPDASTESSAPLPKRA